MLRNAFENLSTEAKQDAANILLNDLKTALAGLQTELNKKIEAGDGVLVDNFPSDYPDSAVLAKLELIRLLLVGTLNVNTGLSQALTDSQLRASALPLPVGASTLSEQQTQTTALASILNKDFATQATLAALSAKITQAFQSSSTSQAVVLSGETATGNITTQNLVPAGVATGGSAVEITLNGNAGLIVQVTGTYTGALSLQVTVDGTTWVTVGTPPFWNVNTSVASATIPSAAQAIYQVKIHAGVLRARITGLAAISGTATVTIRSTATNTVTDIGAPLPTGTNSIGNIGTVSTLSQFLASAASADATANPTTTGERTFAMRFNGSTWDRSRNNVEVTLLTSAARTTTQTSSDITTFDAKKLIVVLDMTVVGTGSVTLAINGKDTASGKYYNILTSTAITANGLNRFRVGESLASVANSVAQDYLPRFIQIVVTANNANSATYSVGYVLGL